MQVFNILCEQPETVAAFLVPRARTVAARGQTGRYIKFLTLPRAMLRFLTAPLHSNRFFDGQGVGKACAFYGIVLGCLSWHVHLTDLVALKAWEGISKESSVADGPSAACRRDHWAFRWFKRAVPSEEPMLMAAYCRGSMSHSDIAQESFV